MDPGSAEPTAPPRPRRASPGALAAALAAAATVACGEPSVPATGTPELRAALVDTILARTERREAFSAPKNEALGFDPLEAMRAVRDRVVRADDETDLFYALAELSAARRDRHLQVLLAPGGIEPPGTAGLEWIGGDEGPEPRVAPVRIFPDYGVDGAAYFVGDVAEGVRIPGVDEVELPSVGARVVEVDGMPVAQWHQEAARYIRHSTVAGLRWKVAEAMNQATAVLPPALREPAGLTLTVEEGGATRTWTLPWSDPGSLRWSGSGEPRYPGTEVVLATPTYDLRVPAGPSAAADHLVLVWYGFRETMVEDVDRLVEHAEQQGLLDRTLVVDVTRSRGGSLGPYAMQRLQARPFRTTFGNLRISDVIPDFVAEKRAEFAEQDIDDGGVPEIIDDGTWLMDWLEHDVEPAVARGDAWTDDVPFKSAHAPRDSDGVLQPAPVHFRGPFAIISGPSGGSHLDQFVAIASDNGLGPVVGMPPGGYSNTWEWEEVLTFPGTDQPVVGFMWNIGHTIRPNGEVLEGNPVQVDARVPLTAENVEEYYGLLLERALELAGSAEWTTSR